MADVESKLIPYGFRFVNWPGGEGPAEAFGISHAVVVPPQARTVVVGGQLGIREDGTVPENIEEEIREAFDHVLRALKAVGLGENAWEFVYSVSPDLPSVTSGSLIMNMH
jgi:enamine deaminase RidA (YjgF/YER057c/UK114 family)